MIVDRLIRMLRVQKQISIEPFSIKSLQPISYEVHLGEKGLSPQLRHRQQFVDLGDPDQLPENIPFNIPRRNEEPIMLISPGEFFLACVEETLALSVRIAGELHGKSTLGRAGLLVHVTAGLVDPGWVGRLTVECKNLAPYPIRIWRGMPIGQIVFHNLGERVDRAYGDESLESHYQADMTVVGSRGLNL